jgi:hypothetical protein
MAMRGFVGVEAKVNSPEQSALFIESNQFYACTIAAI